MSFNALATATDCYTTADDTWSCGTPSSSDNLFINHQVTISGSLNTSGNITISNGGSLTITGNLTTSANEILIEFGILSVDGNITIEDKSTFIVNANITTKSSIVIRSGASFTLHGSAQVDGKITLDGGSAFVMKRDSDLSMAGNFSNYSNLTEVDGVLTIGTNLVNNNLITGIGEISFINCSGTGLINDVTSGVYCSSSPIDLFSSHCSATDNEPPEFTSYPSDIIAYADVDDCGTAVQWTTPLVTDNCSIDDIVSTSNSGDIFPVGNTKVTYTVFDKASNNAQTTFNILVIDSTSPSIIGLPDDISIEADLSTCGANVTWAELTATDNCSAILSSDYYSGNFFSIGITTVTYSAEDPSGNVTIKSFDIEVTYSHIPVFTDCPSDMMIYTNADNCDAIVTWDELEIVGCGVTISQSHKPGDLLAIGLHDVVYSATDISGNTATCNFSIQVLDTISPVIQGLPNAISMYADLSTCGANVTWTEPIATDNCSAILNSDYNPGDFFSIGLHDVVYSATDISGNAVTRNFSIQVLDTLPPVFEFCPTDFEIVSIDSLNEKSVISWEEPIAADLCSETMLISNYRPGDSFSFGTTTIVYTASDEYGNASNCRFDVQSGINNPPSIESQYFTSKAGESLDICLIAEDPDGDQLNIKTIRANGAHATIEDVDSLALCFVYTSIENFGGTDTVLVEIVDDGLPNMSAFTEVVIEVEREQTIFPSSAITPNGDGNNDIWIIKNIDLYSGNSVSIYDRWGGLIYNEAGYNNLRIVWDGSNMNGAIVPTDTYFFVINIENNENITGPIEVIR